MKFPDPILAAGAIFSIAPQLLAIAQCGSNDGDGDGWTTSAGDCDDNHVEIYPGALEICDDGIDSDCSGLDDPCDPVQDAGGTWSPQSFDSVYDVGPEKPFADPNEVPWESLQPNSLVRIFFREEPYRCKWVINTEASESAPIVVQGQSDEGRQPVIDGQDALTRTELSYWNENRSVVKVGGSNLPTDDVIPTWIYIENLDLRGAHPENQFTDDDGRIQNYADNGASVHIEVGQHITVRACQLHDSGNGLFVSPASESILIRSNYIYDNGNEGSLYEHNTYTEALGIIYEFNRFGPLRGSAEGNNLKDRSSGTIIRYNWIEGGNRQLDLVESDNDTIINDPAYYQTFVYGNMLYEDAAIGNSQIIHYGGDGVDTGTYRNGTLYLYYNTIVSLRPENTTLVRLSSSAQTADIRSNIVYASAGEGRLAILAGEGTVTLQDNWLQAGWVDTHDATAGIVNDNGNLGGEWPGFESLDVDNFRLTGDSMCVDQGGALEEEALAYPVEVQYLEHQGGQSRATESSLDIGGFEYGL